MKTILIPRHGVLIIFIIRSNMSCIDVLTCTQNLCNLILAVGFNFGANMTIRYSLNHWDQSIIVGSSQDLKSDRWRAFKIRVKSGWAVRSKQIQIWPLDMSK